MNLKKYLHARSCKSVMGSETLTREIIFRQSEERGKNRDATKRRKGKEQRCNGEDFLEIPAPGISEAQIPGRGDPRGDSPRIPEAGNIEESRESSGKPASPRKMLAKLLQNSQVFVYESEISENFF